jgi:hypothetical protein
MPIDYDSQMPNQHYWFESKPDILLPSHSGFGLAILSIQQHG